MKRTAWLGILLCCLAWPAQALELWKYLIYDLSHPYDQDTIYWPTSPSRFDLTELAAGETEGGWYYTNGMMILAPSAFFIIGLFIWAIRAWKTEQVEEPEYQIADNMQYKEAM